MFWSNIFVSHEKSRVFVLSLNMQKKKRCILDKILFKISPYPVIKKNMTCRWGCICCKCTYIKFLDVSSNEKGSFFFQRAVGEKGPSSSFSTRPHFGGTFTIILGDLCHHVLIFQFSGASIESMGTLVKLTVLCQFCLVGICLMKGESLSSEIGFIENQHHFTKHFFRYLKWRNPKTYISCVDTAYLREFPHPQNSRK